MQYCKVVVFLLILWGLSLILNFKFNSLISVCKNALELHLTTLCYCSSLNTQNHMIQCIVVVVVVVVVTPSSLSRLLVILYQDFLGNF